MEHPARLCPAGWPAEASEAERRGWLGVLAVLPLPTGVRDRWLRLALADPAPAVRAAALRLVDRRSGGSAGLVTAAPGRDDSPAEARFAARLALDTGATRRQDPPAALLRSPVASVRLAAEQARAARLAAGVVAGWDAEAPPARATRLAACLAAPGGAVALRARLTPPRRADPATRLRLRSIRRTLAAAAEPAPPDPPAERRHRRRRRGGAGAGPARRRRGPDRGRGVSGWLPLPPPTLAARLLQTPGGLDDVSDAVVASRGTPLAPLLLGLGVLLTVLAAHSLRRRLQGLGVARVAAEAGAPDPGPAPLRTAWSICRARRVSWPGRLLLWRIARRSGFGHPLPLLAASGTLYHHGRQYAAGRDAARRRRVLRGVSRLQRELFAQPRPVAPGPRLPAPSAAPPADRRSRPRAGSPADPDAAPPA